MICNSRAGDRLWPSSPHCAGIHLQVAVEVTCRVALLTVALIFRVKPHRQAQVHIPYVEREMYMFVTPLTHASVTMSHL